MPNTGKAAIFKGPKQPLEVKEFETSAPGDGELLLKLKRSGICGTDVHIHEGRLPMPKMDLIPGHEFIGEIIDAGKNAEKDGVGNKLTKGDVAIACVAISCGKCFNCKNGETASCLNFGVTYVADPVKAPHFFGGYAEYLYSPAKLSVKVPAGLDLDAVAAFPCAGPTSLCAFGYAGGLKGDELVVVQGTGPVGLFAIAYAKSQGCTVVAIGSGTNPKRNELVKKLGAIEILDYRKTTPEERAKFITDLAAKMGRGNGADVVFEASGSPQAINEGLNIIRTRGRYIVPGQYSNSGGIEIQPQLITFKAVTIVGSGQYSLNDIKTYLSFLVKNPDIAKVFASCVTHKWKVAQANEAMKAACAGDSIKAVFA